MNDFTNKRRPYLLLVCCILIFSACNKDEVGGPIEDQITEAGSLATDRSVSGSPILTEIGSADILPPYPSDLGMTTCSTQTYSALEVRELSGLLTSDAFSGVFPGGIFQGKPFEEVGQFVPVTIPKAGGNLTLEGLSGGNKKTIFADAYEYGEVTEKIAELLSTQSGTIQGTTADFTYSVQETGSRQEFLFNIGLDARYGLAQIESGLNISKTHEKNTVILEFRQIFYSIGIDDPETMYSLFEKEKKAKDPENQISADNPPLYVSKVYYGRQIFFRAESHHSTEDLKASLAGAYKGLTGSIKLSSGFTHEEVINSSNVSYIVRGGGADIALKPIQSSNIYKGILNVIAEGGEWSEANPGAAIGFDLKYLHNRAPARMAFTADFIRKGCELDPTPPATRYVVEATKIQCIDCEPFWENENGAAEFDIDAYVSSNEESNRKYLKLDINNVPLWGTKAYSGKKQILSFQEVDASDRIYLSAIVTELDATSPDSFGEKKKTINLSSYPDGGGFSLYYSIGSGGNKQEVRVWFRIFRE